MRCFAPVLHACPRSVTKRELFLHISLDKCAVVWYNKAVSNIEIVRAATGRRPKGMFQDLSKVRMTVAKAMTECLSAEGISTVFGYPGAAICPFYDELYKTDIRHILVRHEVNGGHAASGYARITGKPAVAIATSGPGALNLITAIATAYMDSECS